MTGPLPDPAFWSGRRVLVTGHTGFKGTWLTHWLRRLGADVVGVALPEPVSAPSLWEQARPDGVLDLRADLAAGTAAGSWVDQVRPAAPSVVLHLAAQPLVPVGWARPAATWASNVQGTATVLELVGALPSVVATVVVTTDKVYDPASPVPHRETAPLGGHDPYSASKAAAELVVASWPAGTPRGTARAGNVIGGGDWAEDRLVPDLVRAWSAGRTAALRSPDGVRPWQHVLEPLRGYLLHAEALAAGVALPAVNLGPADGQSVDVAALVEHARTCWDAGGGALPVPAWTAQGTRAYAETGVLTLDSSLAREVLGWTGALSWQEAVALTVTWYQQALAGADPADLVAQQLTAYCDLVERAPAA